MKTKHHTSALKYAKAESKYAKVSLKPYRRAVARADRHAIKLTLRKWEEADA